MKRREFINWAEIGLIASYFPVALVACTDNADANKSSDAATASSEEFISLGTRAQLQETGFLLNEESKIMAIEDNNGQLSAVNPTCTHRGCTVEWQHNANAFVCPCHGAKFAPDGKVLAKPAPSSLSSYEVKQSNGEILVKLG